jgi:hypothetical protein
MYATCTLPLAGDLDCPQHSFRRLFMVPGMNHDAGGPGTERFDMVTALKEWVRARDGA